MSDIKHEVDWAPIYISSTIIALSLIFLYYKLIIEVFNVIKICLENAQGMISNRDALSHLLFGWPTYLFGIKHEYGYGSRSTASEIALKNIGNLFNKTIIITGGNSGIGYSMCNALCAVSHEQSDEINPTTNNDTPCCIIMASQNKTKSETVIKQLLKQYPKANIRFIPLDLAKLQSIITFVNTLKKLPKNIQNNIKILINNAGVSMIIKAQSVKFDNNLDQRFEKTFAINYLGPFILTQFIFETYFKHNKNECRIINQSSILHTVASAYWKEDLLTMDRIIKYHINKDYNHVYAYGASKLFNIIHAKMMMDEYKKYNVLFNACHPGISSDTGMSLKMFSEDNRWVIYIGSKIVSWIMKSNDQMGANAMLLACDKRIKLNNITGEYFEDCGVKQPSNYANDKQVRDNLRKYSFSIYDNIK
eukprot:180340_1